MSPVIARRALFAAAGIAAFAANASAEPSIELGTILDKYADALRAADVEATVRLFTANGSYLLPDRAAAVGHDALRAAYRQLFATLKIDPAFDIWEAAKYAEVGWLRATSKARLKMLATGKEGTFFYNDLVVFQPEGGVWKIRSYVSVAGVPAPAEKAK